MNSGSKKDLDTLIAAKIEVKTPGMDITEEQENPKELFFQYVQEGDITAVKKMLDQGIDPNEKNVFDATALMLAAHNGHTDMVKELLARGAKVDTRSDDGVTALMTAAYEGHLDIVKELLNKGADVNARSNSGLTALSVAKEKNHIKIINLLEEAQKNRTVP